MATATRKCTGCKNRYQQSKEGWMKIPAGWFHHEDCAVEYAQEKAYKQRMRDQKKAEKKKTTRIALKDKGLDHHWKITKQVMQKYAKLRDIYYNRPCITCDKHHLKTYARNGSMPTGGHYKTGGAHKNLQFNLWNINMEHLFCNSFDPDHLAGMRKNLIERIGLDKVLWLESDPKYNEDWSDKAYLARMRKIFNKRMKRYM